MNKNSSGGAILEGDVCSVCCRAVGCLIVLHGRSRDIAMCGVHSWHLQVVAVERVGVGGVALISRLCVLVCERQRGREQEITMGLCEAPMPGEMFCTVGVFPQDVKDLCWRGGVMCEVHSTGSTAEKV